MAKTVELMNPVNQLMKIGEVALSSGLPVKTIRYYDEIGLLAPAVERSDSGYRLFRQEVLNRLAFIRRAQSLGLQLTEIHQILKIHDQGHIPCGEVRQHLEAKVIDIEQQIAALETLKRELQQVLSGWQEPIDTATLNICPNLQKDLHPDIPQQ